MFLKRIHLKRFACLHDFTAEFQPGLNVIRGPNESGKSTLHQALLMALMVQPTHNQKTHLWCNWNSDQWYELRLDFTDQAGRLYQITKDFHANSQTIVQPNGEFVKGRDGVDRALADTLGTNSMVIVQSTLCVEQDALAAIADGRREISQSLETVLTGSEDDIYTNQALKRLENHIKEFRKGADRLAAQPGPLAKAREVLEQHQKRARDASNQLAAHGDEERQLIDIESRLAQLDRELRPLQLTLEQAGRSQKAESDLLNWSQQEAALEAKHEQVKSAQEKVVATEAELKNLGATAGLTDAQKQAIDQLAGRVVNLREERTRNQNAIARYEVEIVTYQQRQADFARQHAAYLSELATYSSEQAAYEEQLGAYYAAQAANNQGSAGNAHPEVDDTAAARYLWLWLLLGGVIAAVAGVVWIAAANNIVAGGALVAAGLLLMATGVWQWRRKAGLEQATATNDELNAPVVAARLWASAVELPARPVRPRPEPPTPLAPPPDRPIYDETPLRAAEAQLQRELAVLGCQSIDELNGRYGRVVELRRQQEMARSWLAGLLANDTVEGLEGRRREVSRWRRDVEETLQDSALQSVATMTAVQINQLNGQIAQLEAEQSQKQDNQRELTFRRKQQLISREELLQAQEAEAAAVLEYARAEEHIATCELAFEVLTKARSRTLGQAQERLGPMTAHYLRALTNGRYQTAWIDANLNIALQDPTDSQRRIEPHRLSRGARDQLYMAARLALVDLLFPQTRPPILLDDPFVHFDPARLAAAIRMCCEVAQKRQLLLFTCSDQYNHVGHQIVMPAVGE